MKRSEISFILFWLDDVFIDLAYGLLFGHSLGGVDKGFYLFHRSADIGALDAQAFGDGGGGKGGFEVLEAVAPAAAYGGGKRLPGLVRRRKMEADLYFS